MGRTWTAERLEVGRRMERRQGRDGFEGYDSRGIRILEGCCKKNSTQTCRKIAMIARRDLFARNCKT